MIISFRRANDHHFRCREEYMARARDFRRGLRMLDHSSFLRIKIGWTYDWIGWTGWSEWRKEENCIAPSRCCKRRRICRA